MKSIGKVPVWEEDNDPKLLAQCIESTEDKVMPLVKTNNELKKFLEDRGWKYWDRWSIWETGMTWYFDKTIDGVRLSFSWHYHYEGEDETDWRGTMRVVYDFHTDDKHYHPMGEFEIFPIHSHDTYNFDGFEKTIVSVYKTLSELKHIKPYPL